MKALLIIEDMEIPILLFSLALSQGSDVTGRPSQKPVFKNLMLTVESRKEVNFYEWMLARNIAKNFEIHILPTILGGRIRKLLFFDVHLVHHQNNFSSTGNEPLSETLTITTGGFEDSFSSGIYEASWRVSYNEEEGEATVIDAYEPTFLGYFFEDENGEAITQDQIKYNQKITLVIETENAEGRSVKINLNDDRLDFKYNNRVLENDTLTGVSITGQQTRVSLTAIEEEE